jgi:hypothetical protein
LRVNATFDLKEEEMSEDDLYRSGTTELILTSEECDAIRAGISSDSAFLANINAASPDQDGCRRFLLAADALLELTVSVCTGSLHVQQELFAIDDKISVALNRLRKDNRTT